jgi:hypothetical protein
MRLEKLIHQQVFEFRMIYVETCPGITAWNGIAMTRTHVIGGPGSGKTTLAEQLSVYLHIPWYELDTIGWQGGFGTDLEKGGLKETVPVRPSPGNRLRRGTVK